MFQGFREDSMCSCSCGYTTDWHWLVVFNIVHFPSFHCVNDEFISGWQRHFGQATWTENRKVVVFRLTSSKVKHSQISSSCCGKNYVFFFAVFALKILLWVNWVVLIVLRIAMFFTTGKHSETCTSGQFNLCSAPRTSIINHYDKSPNVSFWGSRTLFHVSKRDPIHRVSSIWVCHLCFNCRFRPWKILYYRIEKWLVLCSWMLLYILFVL